MSFQKPLLNSRAFCEEVSADSEDQSKTNVDPLKDRSKVIPVEVSIKYLQSSGK